MSKLTQIENALKAIDPAGFQRLCDSYLRAIGYRNINSVGLVTGAEKVKQGTPDTFIPQADGTYVFAEYTTQQDGLLAKFEGDLENCFDSAKTGIPVSEIREIILCHNSTLDPADDRTLREICLRQGVGASFFGLHTIAQDLFQEYPGLALDFLGVNVDSGQILSATEFVSKYNRGALATPLDTTFRFRGDEVSSILAALESCPIVLISGRPGVGKSRLALECCARYEASHAGTVVRCVLPRGRDLFDDLVVHFKKRAHYLIFVDDANRVNRFEFALQLLDEQSDERSFRFIATVRDYALEKARETARRFGASSIIEVTPLKDDEIKELARDQFGILNDLYLDRIVDIAKGNPRLAIMAALVIERKRTLSSIDDATDLYDEYFASIRRDVEDLNNPSLLLVAGLVAFFRTIDRANTELINGVTEAFGISDHDFWACVNRLHELEAVDMYEDEIVRVSDQVLATYLVYVAVFKKRGLDFGLLLNHFFPAFSHRFIDMLNSVLGAFDHNAIRETLRPHINRAWSLFQQRGDDDLRQFINVFWFVKPTDSLAYLHDAVQELDPEPRPMSELKFAPGTQVNSPGSVLGLLDNFRGGGADTRRMALDILVDYLEKRPNDLPSVLRILTEHWGIDHLSHIYGFQREHQMVAVLCERAQAGRNELISRVLLAVAEHFLRTHFHSDEMKDHRTVTVRMFQLPVTTELLALRRKLWGFILALYSVPNLKTPVLEFLRAHGQSAYHVRDPEIIRHDAALVLSFFESSLDPAEYKHCLVVHGYLALLKGRSVEVDAGLGLKFSSKTHEVSRLLLNNWADRPDVGGEAYERIKRERIVEYSVGFDVTDFAEFLNRCAEIIDTFGHGSREHSQVQFGLSEVFVVLSQNDPELFETVFDRHLHSGYCLAGPWRLIDVLIKVRGVGRAYDIISAGEYPGRSSWLLGYFVVAPHQALTKTRLEELYSIYETAAPAELSVGLSHLLEVYDGAEPAIVRVLRILSNRCDSDPSVGVVLSPAFDGRSELSKRVSQLLSTHVDLFAKAYLAACDAAPGTDLSGNVFDTLLSLDSKFAERWVSWIIEKDRILHNDGHRDYSFIWRRPDHRNIVRRVLAVLIAHPYARFDIYSPAEMLFRSSTQSNDKQTLNDRQNAFLDDIIKECNTDRQLMSLLFWTISGFTESRRRNRIATFLRHNNNFDAFAYLPLEAASWGGFGSAVPYLQKRVDFLKSLLPLMNSIELLGHRQHVERKAEQIQAEIEREKREDFIDY